MMLLGLWERMEGFRVSGFSGFRVLRFQGFRVYCFEV